MIACEFAALSGPFGERPHPEFHVFDDGRLKPPFCPRTIEILTVLNDVFDALVPADAELVAEPA